ncbi:MAG: RpoL/Rpb11 RNA polymerase subunit family protein [Candidatus Aenigmatarchaeota archaeon]
MELRKIKEDDKTLFIEAVGETHTLTNTIREELWNDKNVSEAAEIKEHPYLEEPKIFVKVEKGSAREALIKAAERIAEKAQELREKFEKALKS